MTEQTVKRCAACRKEKPVSEMKTCMHAQMHRYVCDSKCMRDFYNPPKTEKPDYEATIRALQSRLDAAYSDKATMRRMNNEYFEQVMRLRQQLTERDALLREFVEYLDGHPENKICSGSTFHRKVRNALSASAESVNPESTDLYRFLEAAAGEGIICGDVDAEDLFFSLYPDAYDQLTAEPYKGGDGEVQS